jgi:hypothetical protein
MISVILLLPANPAVLAMINQSFISGIFTPARELLPMAKVKTFRWLLEDDESGSQSENACSNL